MSELHCKQDESCPYLDTKSKCGLYLKCMETQEIADLKKQLAERNKRDHELVNEMCALKQELDVAKESTNNIKLVYGLEIDNLKSLLLECKPWLDEYIKLAWAASSFKKVEEANNLLQRIEKVV